MAVIRVKMIPGFYLGDDAVLLAADREGIEVFERALSNTRREPATSFTSVDLTRGFNSKKDA